MPWKLITEKSCRMSDDVAKKRRQITDTLCLAPGSFTILSGLSPLSWSILYWCAQNKYPKGRYLSRTKRSLLSLRNCSAMLNKQRILKTLPLKTCALGELSAGLASLLPPWFLVWSRGGIDLSILLWGLRKDSAEDRWWDAASKTASAANIANKTPRGGGR